MSQDPGRALAFAVEKYPERVEVVAVEDVLLESAREKPKRPAYVKVGVPDDLVKELRGAKDKQEHLVLLVRVPKDVLERSESAIILPNEI